MKRWRRFQFSIPLEPRASFSSCLVECEFILCVFQPAEGVAAQFSPARTDHPQPLWRAERRLKTMPCDTAGRNDDHRNDIMKIFAALRLAARTDVLVGHRAKASGDFSLHQHGRGWKVLLGVNV